MVANLRAKKNLTGFENLSGLSSLANKEIRFLEKIGFLNSF